MIRHVVMWKLKDAAMGMGKAELAAEMTRRLEALVGRVPEIRSFQVGRNRLESERSRDLVLIADFDDLEALRRYAAHPRHLEVVDFVKQAVDESRAVDFELP